MSKLEGILRDIKNSSLVSFNDAKEFSLTVNNQTITGKFDPVEYIEKADISIKSKSVALVGPGNCGLLVELLKQKPKKLKCFEPGYLKMASTKFVLNALGIEKVELEDGHIKDCDTKFDVIIVNTGLDTDRSFIKTLDTIISSLAKEGTIYLELETGQCEDIKDGMNSCKPSKAALERLLSDKNVDFTLLDFARLENSLIYKIKHKTEDKNDKIVEVVNVAVAIDTDVEDKMKFILDNGLMTKDEVDECINAFGQSALDDVIKAHKDKETKEDEPVIEKKTKRTRTTRARKTKKASSTKTPSRSKGRRKTGD